MFYRDNVGAPRACSSNVGGKKLQICVMSSFTVVLTAVVFGMQISVWWKFLSAHVVIDFFSCPRENIDTKWSGVQEIEFFAGATRTTRLERVKI